ncbi:MAG: PIN domain-containing protein [Candidatus Lokiarchaeota archaeon]|nr:PIN domain-containing protein [Candidatus Harpocratesius repetitus]
MKFNPKSSVCLDTGIIVLFTSKDPNEKIIQLFNSIREKEKTAFTMKTTIIEVINHLCILQGKSLALIRVAELLEEYPIIQVELNNQIINQAGILKCKHRTTLSYNDCISIAFCLIESISFHTTEKKIKKIPHNTLNKLQVVKYNF